MDSTLVFAGIYFSLLALVLASVLLGEQPRCRGTPLSWTHWLVTQGICVGIERAAVGLCGERGRQGLDRLLSCCCEGSNPAVQILFLVMLGGGYAAYFSHVFPMLGHRVSTCHMYIGSAALVMCLVFFAAASFCDPGVVTPTNLHQHMALYPHDGLLYEPARCTTCGLTKPARSKHCRVADSCIARADHYCIWINAPVGLLNTRWFILMLASVAALCAYGSIIAVRAVLDDMFRRDAWSLAYVHPRTQKLIFLGDSWYAIAQFITRTYSVQAALVLFLTAMGWVVAGFLAYHLWLIARGVTTNESFKWSAIQRTIAERTEQAEIMERVDRVLAAGSNVSDSGNVQQQQQQHGRQTQAEGDGGGRAWAEQLPPNPYHRGVWCNFSEVFFPSWHLRRAAAAKKRC